MSVHGREGSVHTEDGRKEAGQGAAAVSREGERGWAVMLNPACMLGSTERLLKVASARFHPDN